MKKKSIDLTSNEYIKQTNMQYQAKSSDVPLNYFNVEPFLYNAPNNTAKKIKSNFKMV